MTISQPLADLRTKPQPVSQDFSHDDLRNSQMLYGERAEVLKRKDKWLYVYAPEQGIFGWLHEEEVSDEVNMPTHVICDFHSELPFGSFATEGRPLAKKFCKKQLVEDALLFLGAPYLWGGRASYQNKPIGSVDCSGLINLLYRAQGIFIPRDSGPQALFAKKIRRLGIGDLLYLGDPVCHVLLKVDHDLFIEAPETGKSVRLLKWGRDIWEHKKQICIFDRDKHYPKHYRRIA